MQSIDAITKVNNLKTIEELKDFLFDITQNAIFANHEPFIVEENVLNCRYHPVAIIHSININGGYETQDEGFIAANVFFKNQILTIFLNAGSKKFAERSFMNFKMTEISNLVTELKQNTKIIVTTCDTYKLEQTNHLPRTLMNDLLGANNEQYMQLLFQYANEAIVLHDPVKNQKVYTIRIIECSAGLSTDFNPKTLFLAMTNKPFNGEFEASVQAQTQLLNKFNAIKDEALKLQSVN